MTAEHPVDQLELIHHVWVDQELDGEELRAHEHGAEPRMRGARRATPYNLKPRASPSARAAPALRSSDRGPAPPTSAPSASRLSEKRRTGSRRGHSPVARRGWDEPISAPISQQVSHRPVHRVDAL